MSWVTTLAYRLTKPNGIRCHATESTAATCQTGRLVTWVILLLCATWLGCEKDNSTQIGIVRGTVTLNGKAVSVGTLKFQNDALGMALMTPLTADGTFDVKTYRHHGLPVGTYKVAVLPDEMVTKELPPAGADFEPHKNSNPVAIPQRYQKPATSPLLIEVKAGDNPLYAFELKS